MRYALTVLLLFALLSSAPAQENEAEKLFRAMEQKLVAAKAIHVEVELEVTEKGKEDKGQASLLLTRANKMRFKFGGSFLKRDRLVEVVCDGTRMSVGTVPAGPDPRREFAVPKAFHTLVSKAMSRGGTVDVYFLVRAVAKGVGAKEEVTDAASDKLFGGSDFKSAGKDAVRGREARMIDYRARFGGKEARVTLWLDARTLLPLKRLIVEGQSQMRIVELYNEFKLDPKVDAQAFALPR